jgi:MFS family permease/pSer/pThr/pTyr-binding forkhead associated (FHA) protein
VKRCPVCNTESPDDRKFCPRDGTRLPDPPAPVDGSPALKATLLFRSPDGVIREATLEDKPVSIGNAPANVISLADPTISRFHAIVERQNERFVIIPGGRRADVYVNNQRIQDNLALTNGDAIDIGRTRFTFNVIERPQPPASKPAVVEPRVAPKPDEAETVLHSPQPQPPPIQSQQQPQQPPESATSKDLDGAVLDGRYHIDWKITEGSTSSIYRARRALLGDKVAVRVLNPELVRDKGAFERFRRHAQVAARLRHPNSVQIFDYGTSPDGYVYLVEELLTGMTLRDLLQRERGLTLSRVVGIFNQICGAVHAAHINGIVLRDLKPESIFIEYGPDGKEIVKVGGYGLAKVGPSVSTGATMALQARQLGKAQYRSPEQWLESQLDSRSDVYSLGIILFEMLTGTVPFDSPNPMEIARMHMQSSVPDITEYGRRDLDEGVAAVIQRALSKDPAQRQPTALYLASEFEAASGASGGMMGRMFNRATGLGTVARIVIPQAPAPVPAGEAVLPSVVAKSEEKAGGTFNGVVLALMAEAFISKVSGGMIKTAVPLYGLLVFGLNITEVLALAFIQNIVPLIMRPLFGTWADKYGKKRVFLISLAIRTLVGGLYAIANIPLLYGISLVRGMADSAKGPSASAMIADNTDEKHIARAYSWYTTTKSTSGGIGESLTAFLLVMLIVIFGGSRVVTANIAVLEGTTKSGAPVEEIVKSPADATIGQPLTGQENIEQPRNVVRVEQRQMQLGDVPLDDLPKVVDTGFLKNALVALFIASTILSSLSFLLVLIFIKEKEKEKKKKDKDKGKDKGSLAIATYHQPPQQPNVWAFALLGAALSAPAYMVTGEFFVALCVKLELTGPQLGMIKLIAETIVPLLFGPFFGWLADRLGSGKVIGLRSIANIATSALFYITPWFAGTAFLGLFAGFARAVDEIGKAAFKPTWGAIAAKVSSFNPANRSRTMGIMEGGVDASDLAFPPIAGLLFQYLSLGVLMIVRLIIAAIAEVYAILLIRKYRV